MGAILRQIYGYQYFGHGTSPHRGDTWTIKNKNNRFFIYGPHCDLYIYILLYLWGPGGPSIVILVPSSFPEILSPISIYVKNNNLI